MKPVMQTIFDNKRGNCLAACVATLFDLDLIEVPNFIEAEDWLGELGKWIEKRGHWVLQLDPPQLKRVGYPPPKGYSIMTGKSPRGDWSHAVVAYDGEMVHDPHPSGDGIVGEPNEWMVFVDKMGG